LTDKGQPLSGDFTFNRIISDLANIIFDKLVPYGFINSGENGQHGHLSIDSQKFDQFMQRSDASTILKDFANTFDSYLNNYIDTTQNLYKTYTNKINYLNDQIDVISKQINEQIETMRQQFINLEVYMSQMESIKARISSFAAGLNKTS
jgi:flagellar hook-associated protein 2